MKLISIILIIFSICLSTAGLWLWGGLLLIAMWYLHNQSFPKLRAIYNIIRADRFMCCTTHRDNYEVRVYNSYPYHLREYTKCAETIIEQSQAVSDVQDMINQEL